MSNMKELYITIQEEIESSGWVSDLDLWSKDISYNGFNLTIVHAGNGSGVVVINSDGSLMKTDMVVGNGGFKGWSLNEQSNVVS